MATDFNVLRSQQMPDAQGYLERRAVNAQNIRANNTAESLNQQKITQAKLTNLHSIAQTVQTPEDVDRAIKMVSGFAPEIANEFVKIPPEQRFSAIQSYAKSPLEDQLKAFDLKYKMQQMDMAQQDQAMQMQEFQDKRNGIPIGGTLQEGATSDDLFGGTTQEGLAESPINSEPQKPRQRMIGGKVYDVVDGRLELPKPAPKPMPASVSKQQATALDEISLSNQLKADLEPLKIALDNGDLDLGPITNAASIAQNKIGQSTVNSRNYANLKTTINGIRNKMLRLNKGTQTEGDAIRAMDEILSNFNDVNFVKSRLATFINDAQRRSDATQASLDQTRAEYGLPELDYNKYINQPTAIQVESKGGKSTTPTLKGGAKFLGYEE